MIRFDFLKTVEIFKSLDRYELDNLSAFLTRRAIYQDEVLFHEGDEGDELYIVYKGKLGISVELPSGDYVEVAEFGPGDFFGEMSIFQKEPRSAACVVKEDGVLLSLKANDFFRLGDTRPQTSIRIIHRMLDITVNRLRNTNGLLSDMVQWGEEASRRAATDEHTGLYNREFFDTTLKQRLRESRRRKEPLCLSMIDLDRFGKLNKQYGEALCDLILKKCAEVFQSVFSERDIIARYGGDEFAVILPGRSITEAAELCTAVCRNIRQVTMQDNSGHPIILTTSIGVASVQSQKISGTELIRRADEALYQAKEAGKDRSVCYGVKKDKPMKKSDITSIAAKNKIIRNIAGAMQEGDTFLILGHHNPDEDCIASMVSISLMLKKLNKSVFILLTEEVHERYHYLLNICRYNAIRIISDCSEVDEHFDTICVVDTPKPAMLQTCPSADKLLKSPEIRLIEFDHHLAADSAYIAPLPYALVADASSTCEHIGYLALKMCLRPELAGDIDLKNLFTRNFVLAVLTGIVGDSKMGKYIKNRKEQWYYDLFSTTFAHLLEETTEKGSSNLSTIDEVFDEITRLSRLEELCFSWFMEDIGKTKFVHYSLLPQKHTNPLPPEIDLDLLINTARAVTDSMAEKSGKLGMVAYYDPLEKSDLIQFRLRRSHTYRGLDLRNILSEAGITNGGGHEGAVGFRIPRSEVPNLQTFVDSLIRIIEGLAENPV